MRNFALSAPKKKSFRNRGLLLLFFGSCSSMSNWSTWIFPEAIKSNKGGMAAYSHPWQSIFKISMVRPPCPNSLITVSKLFLAPAFSRPCIVWPSLPPSVPSPQGWKVAYSPPTKGSLSRVGSNVWISQPFMNVWTAFSNLTSLLEPIEYTRHPGSLLLLRFALSAITSWPHTNFGPSPNAL